MGRVTDKVALVTGAAQGLGAAIAAMLAREGANVVLSDINIDGVRQQAAKINSAHAGRAIAIEHDVTDADQWVSTVDKCKETYGGLNILVNNAGIGSIGNVVDETIENWRRVHAIDWTAYFLAARRPFH